MDPSSKSSLNGRPGYELVRNSWHAPPLSSVAVLPAASVTVTVSV